MSTVSVTVNSVYPSEVKPHSGTLPLPKGEVAFSVKSPYREERTLGGWFNTKWTKVWTCTGWTGTGDIPEKGVGTYVKFNIQNDSSITWIWVSQNQVGAQVLSFVAFIAVLAIALAGYYVWQRPFIVAIFAGALGGLAHEIVQSGGKYVLPNSDEKGNFVLGGLIGIITGGVAGLLLYQGFLGTPPIVVDAKLGVGALLAGLAVKGIADAPNPK